MRKILLICSTGMSTSLLVSKMKKEAAARGVNVDIWAVSLEKATSEMEKADLLLAGPQIKFANVSLEEAAKGKGILFDVINPVDYGRMNGDKVLQQALDLLGIR